MQAFQLPKASGSLIWNASMSTTGIIKCAKVLQEKACRVLVRKCGCSHHI